MLHFTLVEQPSLGIWLASSPFRLAGHQPHYCLSVCLPCSAFGIVSLVQVCLSRVSSIKPRNHDQRQSHACLLLSFPKSFSVSSLLLMHFELFPVYEARFTSAVDIWFSSHCSSPTGHFWKFCQSSVDCMSMGLFLDIGLCI